MLTFFILLTQKFRNNDIDSTTIVLYITFRFQITNSILSLLLLIGVDFLNSSEPTKYWATTQVYGNSKEQKV